MASERGKERDLRVCLFGLRVGVCRERERERNKGKEERVFILAKPWASPFVL